MSRAVLLRSIEGLAMKICNWPVLMAAFAATAIAALPQSAMAEPFEGEYVGIQGGLATTKSTGNTVFGPFDVKDNSPVAVAVAGYRAKLGSSIPVVVGLEGDIGFSVDHGEARIGVSAIAGPYLGKSALIYGRVGYASQSGVATRFESRKVDGLMFGGGVEANLLKHVNLRVDYRHMDYGKTPTSDAARQTLKFSGQEITGGLILDF